MKYDKMYEKLSGLIALELFDNPDSQKMIEAEFQGELVHLNNMSLEIFSDYDVQVQYEILRIYDVYFRNGQPILDDAFYDTLYVNWSKKSGRVDNVIMFEPTIDAWAKAKHKCPMGSLDKQNTIEEIEKWSNKLHMVGVEKIVSDKLDGIALELVYDRGNFVQAITRGDGTVGDDITENAKHFDGVIKELTEPWDCSVRGEIVITKDNFVLINEILVANGKDPLKNTRNGVAGQATRFKDRNEDILSLLTFISYDFHLFKVHETGENVI